MNDQRRQLSGLFREQSRYSNFGNVITRITIRGFRCHSRTTIDFESPVTAFCGLNGCGKSTILQLLATAYRDPNRGPWNIAHFFSINAIDTNPFTDDAQVVFRFAAQNTVTGGTTLTLSRQSRSRRWSGYSRRRNKQVYFVGVASYTPLNEQPSYVYRSRNFRIATSTAVSYRTKDWVERILHGSYDNIDDHSLTTSTRRGNTLTSVGRKGTSYGEPNMGFGEARTIHTVKVLENLPDRSLIILEEPETSLHPSAQHWFGKYLVNVAVEKRHQIFLSTHSENLLSALPDASRIYLKRTDTGVTPIIGISSSQANSLMAHGNRPALTILVEDNVAQAIVTEILREQDRDLLQTAKVVIGGDNDILKKTMKGLEDAGLNVLSIADGDTPTQPSINLFKLPGTRAPEKEIFDSQSFKDYVNSNYHESIESFVTQLRDVDHHDWFSRLAKHLTISEECLITESARAYVAGLTLADKSSLKDQIRASLRT